MKLSDLFNQQEFVTRHIGSNAVEQAEMLQVIQAQNMSDFIQSVVPENIRLKNKLDLPDGVTEETALKHLQAIAEENIIYKSYIGQGYYPTLLPKVIQRNVLENPGWYTAYTPYQPEIAQGRLEALLNFQQMCIDLTGLDMAGASLLDEATAAAEAMSMTRRISKVDNQRFFVDQRIFPQTLDVLRTRAEYFGIELIIGDALKAEEGTYFGALFQYVGKDGDLADLTQLIAAMKSKGTIVAIAADVMQLVLLKSPAELGADIALGSTQRFGIPMSFGGPHAAYFAFKDEYKRAAPGRIIGVSRDVHGQPALRMALQTREQHIRREKANSNICTAQVLLANMAGMYAVYHGSVGLKRIARRIHALAHAFAEVIADNQELKLCNQLFFDTVSIDCGQYAEEIVIRAKAKGYNLDLSRLSQNIIAVAFHEASTAGDFADLTEIFTGTAHALPLNAGQNIPLKLQRQEEILQQPVFNRYHSEHEMLRYLKKLEERDLAMNRSMISLGSCTMKLNATAEMLPITWEKWTDIHPFAPQEQVQGYLKLIQSLEQQLKAITGFDAISMQPNSGASGEYAGLVAIRRYLAANEQGHRHICLIPRSAHGTNPASAQMAGLKVVVVDTDEQGNIDWEDLQNKVKQYASELAVFMITYPSTHGVFETDIKEICTLIHAHGGQVYMDGANMNAQVGLMRPADVGADVLHMNLHKTFCIPHGGGGPGMGPIGLKAHLAPFASNHSVVPIEGRNEGMSAVSAAPYGSAGILPISWMYITMMGSQGLQQATEAALLHANYLADCLAADYPILYRGNNGRVAHECIIDLRPLKAASGITEVDIAKRLMDYGFHAPTMSFPVSGTLMIEPTESESKAELDRFIAALKQIKQEVLKVQNGEWPLTDNPLVNAPHTAKSLTEEWLHPYSRMEAVYPLAFISENKFWPSVGRIDEVYGDRHLICSCVPLEEYMH